MFSCKVMTLRCQQSDIVRVASRHSPFMLFEGLFGLEVGRYVVLTRCIIWLFTGHEWARHQVGAQVLLTEDHVFCNITQQTRRSAAARLIQRMWRRAVSNPEHAVCRHRLLWELKELRDS